MKTKADAQFTFIKTEITLIGFVRWSNCLYLLLYFFTYRYWQNVTFILVPCARAPWQGFESAKRGLTRRIRGENSVKEINRNWCRISIGRMSCNWIKAFYTKFKKMSDKDMESSECHTIFVLKINHLYLQSCFMITMLGTCSANCQDDQESVWLDNGALYWLNCPPQLSPTNFNSLQLTDWLQWSYLCAVL